MWKPGKFYFLSEPLLMNLAGMQYFFAEVNLNLKSSKIASRNSDVLACSWLLITKLCLETLALDSALDPAHDNENFVQQY